VRKNDIAAYAVDVWAKVADAHFRMKMLYIVCALAVSGACTQSSPPGETALIHYIGRFTDEAQPQFEWEGSGVVARFNGTGIAVTMSGLANWFETFVDGEPAAKFQTEGGAKTFTIADKLPQGQHTVEVYRRTEALFEPTRFAGFVVSGGELVPSPYPFKHRMLVIGDSISAGYGDLGPLDSGCHLEITTESALLAYPMLTARALKSAVHVIAWSGKGMYRQFADRDVPSRDQMPVLFERTVPTDAASVWNHSRYVPDVIVINLGSNDWDGGDPGEPYVRAYSAFLAHLRQLYPAAEIFCTLGPMLTKPEALQHIKDVVKASGDAHVHYFPFEPIDVTDGYGCDYHPSQATQRKMADALTAHLRFMMSW
jgi:lysophospholipase L1-like esterase